MPKLVRKYGPLLVTVALMAWCCWTQIRGSEPLLANMEEVQLPQIERNALRPEISPLSQRDPFQPPKTEPPTPAVDIAAAEVDSDDPPEPVFDPQTVLSGFRLDATMVGTEYPVAMINGKIYNEGELIELKGFPELQCRLWRVQADRAVLEIEEEEYEIVYTTTLKTPRQISEPGKEVAIQQQLDSATGAVGKEESLAKLLQFLKLVVPNLGMESDASLDQGPTAPPERNEIDIPTTKRDE